MSNKGIDKKAIILYTDLRGSVRSGGEPDAERPVSAAGTIALGMRDLAVSQKAPGIFLPDAFSELWLSVHRCFVVSNFFIYL